MLKIFLLLLALVLLYNSKSLVFITDMICRAVRFTVKFYTGIVKRIATDADGKLRNKAFALLAMVVFWVHFRICFFVLMYRINKTSEHKEIKETKEEVVNAVELVKQFNRECIQFLQARKREKWLSAIDWVQMTSKAPLVALRAIA